MTPGRILTFGEFRLDPTSGHLFRGTEVVALAPKAFTLLQFLAGQAGRLVSKQELLSAVWPGVFVGDAVLKSTIRELRKALGRRFARAAIHRNRASPRLSFHGARHRD